MFIGVEIVTVGVRGQGGMFSGKGMDTVGSGLSSLVYWRRFRYG